MILETLHFCQETYLCLHSVKIWGKFVTFVTDFVSFKRHIKNLYFILHSKVYAVDKIVNLLRT